MTNEEKKVSQVEQEMTNLRNNIQALNKENSLLCERLFPVLKQDEPTPGDEKEDKNSIVGLAEEVREFSEMIQNEYYRINNILYRIEL